MKIKIRHLKNFIYLQFIILSLCSFFFPLYICDTNRHNLSFTLVEIPLMILCFLYLKKKEKRKDKIFGTILLLYSIIFFCVNIMYLECYWAFFYKVGSFLLVWLFSSNLDYSNAFMKGDFYGELTDTILCVFSLAVVLSLLANFAGVDAIFWDLQQFHIRGANKGIFLDERLTWVFMHKSSYGLLLVLALILLMKRKRFPYRKVLILIYFIAAVRINSMVSIACMCAVLFGFYVETKSWNKKTVIKITFAFAIGLMLVGIGYYIVSKERNLSNLGDRAYIWAMYGTTLAGYPHGMGNRFFSDSFWLAAGGRYLNNFHNVMLNEMLHYSVPVGIGFTMLILYYPLCYIKNNSSRMKNLILFIATCLPMLFDQALNDLIFPIFLIMLRLSFCNANEQRLEKN